MTKMSFNSMKVIDIFSEAKTLSDNLDSTDEFR